MLESQIQESDHHHGEEVSELEKKLEDAQHQITQQRDRNIELEKEVSFQTEQLHQLHSKVSNIAVFSLYTLDTCR